jgi:hypothetical protein
MPLFGVMSNAGFSFSCLYITHIIVCHFLFVFLQLSTQKIFLEKMVKGGIVPLLLSQVTPLGLAMVRVRLLRKPFLAYSLIVSKLLYQMYILPCYCSRQPYCSRSLLRPGI